MKALLIPIALVFATSASAGEWVSVGASVKGVPATSAVSSGNPVAPVAPLSPVVPVTAPAPTNLLNELLTQVEQMQQEIAQLRGTVETQSMKIKRLEKDSETRYLDIDRRLVFLTTANGGTSVTAPPASSASVSSSADSESTADTSDTSGASAGAVAKSDVASGSAENAYNLAMSQVREKQFVEANASFEQFVVNFPDDALTANAYYWNGEVYLVRGELASALSNFRKVIDGYPDHVKTPDATYKYAVALDKSGDKDGAKQWLQTVIKRYSGKADSTVRLAQSYLDRINEGV
jgi:tol-pal system protein YbgF